MKLVIMLAMPASKFKMIKITISKENTKNLTHIYPWIVQIVPQAPSQQTRGFGPMLG